MRLEKGRNNMVSSPVLTKDEILGNLPVSLRDELLNAYNLIVKNFREGRWEPSELNGGKLCEVVYTILRGYVNGRFPLSSSKPKNMVDACHALEQAPESFPRSVRIQLPRILIALYEIRNNRGVGHVGGEVNPNEMDATCVLYMSKWIVSELVRIFHNVDTVTAENSIEAIVERILPVVWNVDGKLRVLNTETSMKEKTLILLCNSLTPLTEQQLFEWVEHSNASNYRRDILRQLHNEKLIEFDASTGTVHISPKGIAHTEKEILPKFQVDY